MRDAAPAPSGSETTAVQAGSSGDGTGGSPPDVPAGLIAGLTTLLAALTAIATANGAVTRMFRNFGYLIYLAIFAVLIAFLCGQLARILVGSARKRVVILGTLLLFVGLSLGIFFQVQSTTLNERANITAKTTLRGRAIELDAAVTATGAKAEAQLLVVVFGIPMKGGAAVDTPILYYAKTGPDVGGKLRQDLQLFLPSGRFRVVRVNAAVYDPGADAVTVGCGGEILDDNGHEKINPKTRKPFPRLNRDRTACLGFNLEGSTLMSGAKKT